MSAQTPTDKLHMRHTCVHFRTLARERLTHTHPRLLMDIIDGASRNVQVAVLELKYDSCKERIMSGLSEESASSERSCLHLDLD
jgi:hypothetical protein